jgi:thymidylate kinase
MINRSRVEELKRLARDRMVYLCGSVENEDEVRDLFDGVVCLVLDEPLLRARIANRTTNEFGKKHEQLQAILSSNASMEATCRRLGAAVINADQPLEAVVDEILVAVSCTHTGAD